MCCQQDICCHNDTNNIHTSLHPILYKWLSFDNLSYNTNFFYCFNGVHELFSLHTRLLINMIWIYHVVCFLLMILICYPLLLTMEVPLLSVPMKHFMMLLLMHCLLLISQRQQHHFLDCQIIINHCFIMATC